MWCLVYSITCYFRWRVYDAELLGLGSLAARRSSFNVHLRWKSAAHRLTVYRHSKVPRFPAWAYRLFGFRVLGV